MMVSFVFVTAVMFAPLLVAAASFSRSVKDKTSHHHHTQQNHCIGHITSLDNIAAAVKCKTIHIEPFTVPAGRTFQLKLREGTRVEVVGDVVFGNKSWAGPLFEISGKSIIFNGHGHTFHGGGAFYWDGKGTNSDVLKPKPMMKIDISGTMKNLSVANSPAHVFSIHNPDPLVIEHIKIDNSQGDHPNSKSGGKAAAHNTDGFDVSGKNLIIKNCHIHNQDDCIAINRGENITFENNVCMGGHGVSIGSISSDSNVTDVSFINNTITASDQALRIKTKADAKHSVVKNITYSGNTGNQLRRFGVLIDQSYPSTLATPGTGVEISGIKFIGTPTTLSVDTTATSVAINCGANKCSDFDWPKLRVKGGKEAWYKNKPNLVGWP